MKKNLLFAIVILLGAVALSFISCQKDNDVLTQDKIAYPPTESPFGKSYGEWGLAWWEWAFGFDCASNPITDTDGHLQNQNQSGPVYFLAGTSGTIAVRTVTIPSGKAVFFPLVNYINDFPCPDTSFQPAPGQTLEDFLLAGTDTFLATVTSMTTTLDGTALSNLNKYRGTTGLINFTANADLTNCLDVCVTGTPQPAVSDGYWIMLKPMSAGAHTLHFTATSTYGFTIDVTYNITVQ